MVSNSFMTACNCSKCVIQSITSPNLYWLAVWIFFHMLFIKNRDSHWFWRTKVLNLSHTIETTVLALRFFCIIAINHCLIFQKSGSKGELVETLGSKGGKVVFVMLKKIVIIYIELTLIYVRCSSFEMLFLKLINVF